MIIVAISAVGLIHGFKRYSFFLEIDDTSLCIKGEKRIEFSDIIDVDLSAEEDEKGKVSEKVLVRYMDREIEDLIEIEDDLKDFYEISVKLLKIAKENREKNSDQKTQNSEAEKTKEIRGFLSLEDL
ncbi:hypothetical protein CHISP_2047 [Chitinispirillum alkaliphilum]|nr:hypothetical protein CHISP_2047 [Chitinispirillum alkaliphilum]